MARYLGGQLGVLVFELLQLEALLLELALALLASAGVGVAHGGAHAARASTNTVSLCQRHAKHNET